MYIHIHACILGSPAQLFDMQYSLPIFQIASILETINKNERKKRLERVTTVSNDSHANMKSSKSRRRIIREMFVSISIANTWVKRPVVGYSDVEATRVDLCTDSRRSHCAVTWGARVTHFRASVGWHKTIHRAPRNPRYSNWTNDGTSSRFEVLRPARIMKTKLDPVKARRFSRSSRSSRYRILRADPGDIWILFKARFTAGYAARRKSILRPTTNCNAPATNIRIVISGRGIDVLALNVFKAAGSSGWTLFFRFYRNEIRLLFLCAFSMRCINIYEKY